MVYYALKPSTPSDGGASKLSLAENLKRERFKTDNSMTEMPYLQKCKIVLCTHYYSE